ncbi:unnamed protein product [Adineta steineri]|uniref:Metalloendopeptidase n=1 Tax=Adineta steineri TaxID=433720 RepID=A0A814EW79_9BILA|nr:unnamed protein product [Adineta steineri]
MRIFVCLMLCCLIISCEAHQCLNKVRKRSEIVNTLKWTDNTVPYVITDVFNEADKKLIVDSLAEMTQLTGGCVKFVPHTSTDTNWVTVIDGHGCFSDVGMRNTPGSQDVMLLRPNCLTKSLIMHEFLHTLGFDHEQARPDRDTYVKVIYENIQPKYKYAFDKSGTSGFWNLDVAYDYNSVMHYVYNGFSSNCLPNIVPISKEAQKWRFTMGKNPTMTELDVFKVKKVYGCLN